jgi:hypothetical protein
MSKGLTNQYLEKICKKLFTNTQIPFLGVYPGDIHPRVNKHSFSVIFNTGYSNTNGEHFVAVYVTKTKIHYFDSFGEETIKPKILEFLSGLNKPLCELNCVTIQSDLSNFCGYYCLGFLLSKYKRMATHRFLSLFTTKPSISNDKTVVNFIIKCIS